MGNGLAFLPPYCPELNPVEQLRRDLRRRFFPHRLFAAVGAVIDACCPAWSAVAADPELIRSVTGFSRLPRLKP